MMKKTLLALIRFYQKYISPSLGPKCRYYPTCSSYALEAIGQHGALKGTFFAVRRILCCHPWSKRDYYDPVPGSEFSAHHSELSKK